ncbi:hypothetical protein, partial [Ammonifex thiophilus]|uniref:hypothetical protein n=1 Tax=Ammonifex thiophilus TaxID=444093 RepID=UPI00196A85A2
MRRGLVRRGAAGRGVARLGSVGRGVAGHGVVWHGVIPGRGFFPGPLLFFWASGALSPVRCGL